MSLGARCALAALAVLNWPCAVLANGFDERYDLHAPLGYVVLGAALSWALPFMVAGAFARLTPDTRTYQ